MGIESVADRRPPKAILVNVSTGEEMEVLFNPTQLGEKVSVNYNRLTVPGLSHQVLQYQSTGNTTLSSIEFYLDKYVASRNEDDPDILDFKRFLQALTVPPAGAEDILGGAPPRVLVIWPAELFTLECVITDVEFEYRQFSVDTELMVYAARATFEEIRDMRMTSEELRELGSERG